MNRSHSLTCKELLDNLNDYIDGDLDRSLCADIEAHIDTCPNCQIVVSTLKKTIQLYQVNGQATILPKNMRLRLFARLDLDNYVNQD